MWRALRNFVRTAMPHVIDSLGAVAWAWCGLTLPPPVPDPDAAPLRGPSPGHPERVPPDTAMTPVERELWQQLPKLLPRP